MGKKLLYLSSWDFTNAESDGVCKKIMAQIKAFKNRGYTVDLTYIKNGRTYLVNDAGIETDLGNNHHLSKFGAHRCIASYLRTNSYDFSYIRYNKADPWLIDVLKDLNRRNTRSVIEIPTYPYDKECIDDWRSKIVLAVDKCYRQRMRYYIDRIETCSDDKNIYGIPAFELINGIDVDQVSLPICGDDNENIRMLAVALMSKSQGYERIILGMADYYSKGGNRGLQLNLVGDGPELDFYRKIVRDYSLEEHVIFWGRKGGAELAKLFDGIDIGLASFGLYKIGIMDHLSGLKTREYLAKGLPIVTGCVIDVIEDIDYEYCYEFSNDSSVIDMRDIIAFYDNIYDKNNHREVQMQIRSFAKKTVDIEITMNSVCEYFEKE